LISIIIFAMIRPWSFGMVMVCRADILVDIVDILRYFMCGWSQAYHRRSKMHQREHIFSFCLAAWHYQIMTNRIQQALSNMLHNIYIYPCNFIDTLYDTLLNIILLYIVNHP
jgi:hypothetical protein